MMRTAMIMASTIVLASCGMVADARENGDAGPVTQRSFAVADFDSVSLGGPHNVIVRVGPAASVRAEGPTGELDRLEIEVKNGDLKIRTKKDKWFGSSKGKPVTVYVTTPRLGSAAIGGSGDMKIDRVEGARFAAAIGGSGDMDIASLKVEEASFSIGGSGAIRAAGSAATTDVSIAGSGDIDISGVESRTASVSIAGSGDVKARASDTASVSIVGSGDVEMAGGAKCKVSKMGAGDVRCGA